MARPRTKGDPITIRLLLVDDERFKVLAAAARMTPGEYASVIVASATSALSRES